MRILFVHQNCPGQFKYLAPSLAADGHDVVFVTQPGKPTPAGVRKIEYTPHRAPTPKIHPYLVQSERAVLNGQGVARIGFSLKEKGWTPDVMVGNPGWGETLFLKDVWPDAPLVSYAEFYYRGQGSDVGFDPEFASGPDAVLRARARAGTHLLAMDAADLAYSPTAWQRDQFPAPYRSRIEVIHDGIDCDRVRPDPDAVLALPDGTTLSRDDEVLTYVSRNFEPYRGFHTMMRALPALLDARPEAHVVMVGGDDVSYGSRAPDGKSWRDVLLEDVGPLPARVHVLPRVPYADYLKVLQVSAAHVYLTYPFVLSWSMLEAMAVGCVVLGSSTPPVEEVIEDGVNGRLTDFFDAEALARLAADTLAQRDALSGLREAARRTVLERFELRDCLSRQRALILGAARAGRYLPRVGPSHPGTRPQ